MKRATGLCLVLSFVVLPISFIIGEVGIIDERARLFYFGIKDG